MMIICNELLHFFLLLLLLFETLAQQGDWSAWSNWSECSVSCGNGIQRRRKTWLFTDTSLNNEPSTYQDNIECITNVPCPVDGAWSFWGPWSDCTSFCDGGTTTRRRTCSSPEPQFGGKECDGKEFVQTTCNEWKCPEMPKNFDISLCNETTYMCMDGKQCIPSFNRCDNSLQCHDGSDEYNCYYWSNATGSSVRIVLSWTTLLLAIIVIIPL